MSDKILSDDSVPEDDVEMGFFEHIGELRTRLVYAFYGILPAAALCYYFVEYLFTWIRKPHLRTPTPLVG